MQIKEIYLWFKAGLKQASRQWYLKFNEVIFGFDFKKNVADQCIYHKFKGSKFIFLVVYVDDILLASNDMALLLETKSFLSKNFEMKDLGDVSFVIGIQIQRDGALGILDLSQKTYIDKVIDRCGMKNCSRAAKLSLLQCLKNDLKKEQMKDILYASAVGSLMYVEVCTRLDKAYTIEKLGRYLINLEIDH